jgi:RNA polymerase sigma-70 factor (ECF subfamily)
MLDSALDAEDIAHEAWLVAARRIATFHGDTDDFAGWLFVIARNQVMNTNRRSIRRATTPAGVDPQVLTDEQPIADNPADADAGDSVRRLLDHLRPRERDVVACIDIMGLDVETTARQLGMSRPAVRVAHHRGLKRLEAMLVKAPDDRSSQPNIIEGELEGPAQSTA